MTMMRITGLVRYTDGPLGVVEAHSVQQSATLHPRREWYEYERYDILVAVLIEEIPLKTT